MILEGSKDTITSLWTKGLKALVPPNSFGPPTMVAVVVDFKDRGEGPPLEGKIEQTLSKSGCSFIKYVICMW